VDDRERRPQRSQPGSNGNVTSQGSAVLHTADHGAVTATIAAGEVSVKGFHAAD
jgi:hypothetical protein